jgi:hypothetical protein
MHSGYTPREPGTAHHTRQDPHVQNLGARGLRCHQTVGVLGVAVPTHHLGGDPLLACAAGPGRRDHDGGVWRPARPGAGERAPANRGAAEPRRPAGADHAQGEEPVHLARGTAGGRGAEWDGRRAYVYVSRVDGGGLGEDWQDRRGTNDPDCCTAIITTTKPAELVCVGVRYAFLLSICSPIDAFRLI